jgi:phosphoribosylglycinamide formyltransferase 1
MTRIAIFASGAGSNAKKIIEHSLLPTASGAEKSYEVALIVCNKPNAGVLSIAAEYHIETLLIEKENFFRGDAYIPLLKEKQVDWIILAGFLWKIPSALIKAYPQRIINIHPALLPKYGGKGMYGHFVHEAVIAAGETESGITIHFVDEQYDHGDTIFQASCEVRKEDTPETLAKRIHALEHEHFAKVIEQLLQS